ncbi:MAG: hypothetical protein Kow0026_08400 [Oricola sp.]
MQERVYTGGTITEPGIYRGISLSDYHDNRDLFDGPSVSKSALKWLLPPHGGSPKAFWGRWKWNPDHIEPKTTPALDFGKAVHCLLLGDEVFSEAFAVRPEHRPDDMDKPEAERRQWNANAKDCKAWLKAQEGLTVLTMDQIERIRRIAGDAAKYPLIRQGILNGKVERTLCWKDPKTGIWLKCRPDNMPTDSGIFTDLKSASSFDEDFLERQVFDAGYYLQGGALRMVCRGLGIPFEVFVLLYVLNDEVPDTAHAEIAEFELDRGERAIRWCLDTIRSCLDAGEWPGAQPFSNGERQLQIKPWAKDRLDLFLDQTETPKEAA